MTTVDLLALLNGPHKSQSPPATQQQPALQQPASSPSSASLHSFQTARTSSISTASTSTSASGAGQQQQQSDLDRLFFNAFQTQKPGGGGGDGLRRSESGRSVGGGGTTTTTTATTTNPLTPTKNLTTQSSSLLSMLQGFATPPPTNSSTPTSSSPSQQLPPPTQAQSQSYNFPPTNSTPTSSTSIPPPLPVSPSTPQKSPSTTTDASSLLLQLMGTSLPISAPSPSTLPFPRDPSPISSSSERAHIQLGPPSQHTTSSPLDKVLKSDSRPPTPFEKVVPEGVLRAQNTGGSSGSGVSGARGSPLRNEGTNPFGFTSPFEALDKTWEKENLGRDSPGVGGGGGGKTNTPSTSTFSSTTAPATTTSTTNSSVNKSYLASSYLPLPVPSSSTEETSTSPGIALPPSSHKLSIDISLPHLSSLLPSSSSTETTPITLFPTPLLPPSTSFSSLSLSMHQSTIFYSTKQGRIRLIDRSSGGRGLLKGLGHGGRVGDLRVGGKEEGEGKGGKKRIVVGTGGEMDGKLLVWRVDETCDQDGAPYETLLAVTPNERTTFQIVRLHPKFPTVPIMIVSKSDGSLSVLDLGKALEGKLEKTVGGEEVLEGLGRTTKTGPSTMDIAFSPDGTSFLHLTSTNVLSIRLTSSPTEILTSSQLSSKVSQATFLSSKKDSKPVAIAVASRHSKEVRILPLRNAFDATGEASLEFTLPSTSLVLAGSGFEGDDGHFGQIDYHEPTETLLVSNSLRGSLWAFHLSFPTTSPIRADGDEGEEHESDAAFIAGVGGTNAIPWIDHVLEIPTPEPIISFFLHTPAVSPSNATTAPTDLVALILHPSGIHQFAFTYSPPSSHLPSNDADDLSDTASAWDDASFASAARGAGRRMSLEGSIHVETESAVDVAEPDEDEIAKALSPNLSGEAAEKRKSIVSSVDPIEEVPEPPTSSADEPVVASSSIGGGLSPSPTTSGSGAKSPGGKGKKGKGISKEASPAREAIVNAWAAGGLAANGKKTAGSSGKVVNGTDSVDLLLKELKKFEEILPSKITEVVAKEMEKQAARFEEDRRNDQVADAARQETMLKLVSSTLTKNTSKLVETNIKDAVTTQIVPALGKLVSTALDKSLPDELARLLYRPELTTHLARNFSATVAPALERSILAIVSASVVPTISASVNIAVDSLMIHVQQEMLDVRKEIVREQSGALEFTEQEVVALRADVAGLKETMARMEVAMAAMQKAAVVQTAPANVSRQVSGAQQAFSLPPIPREATPVIRYEETFTNALQPDNEPEFATLLHLVNSSPPSRIEAVFPPKPARSNLSAPVILSLAYRLSQVIGARQAHVDDDERKQLQWIRRCLTTMDGKDPTTAPYTPRILESVVSGLSVRGKASIALDDKRGVEDLRVVEQYARSRLGLFHQQESGARR